MPDLNATVATDFTRYYQEAAKKVHALVESLTDAHIWTRPYPYGNSIGHLLLHLTGNLSYYIGAEIGGTGYVRNRPLEFSDTVHHPKQELLAKFDAALTTVAAVLQKQTEQDWSAAYNAKGMEDSGDRFTAFLRCAAHISHHTGQIMYLCKELEHKNRP
ncbi:MAG TPA: DinB family protein [Candidatus Angelobacter sp.]